MNRMKQQKNATKQRRQSLLERRPLLKPIARPGRPRRQRPKRSYRAVIESLRQVWNIELVQELDAIWQMGDAEWTALPRSGLKVAIWNMCKGAGGTLFEHDYRSLCYRSDIVLTQEALLSRRSMELFCEKGFEATHAASYKRRDGLRDGVMTVARAPSAQPGQRIVCKYPEPVFQTPKVALVAHYKLENTDLNLMVVNIHATLIRGKFGAVEEIRHLIERLPVHNGPMLLAGDFNTFTPGYLIAVAAALSRIGLEYIPIPNDPRPKSQALDQVFLRGLEVEKIEVDTTVKNSDHFPLLVTLRTANQMAYPDLGVNPK